MWYRKLKNKAILRVTVTTDTTGTFPARLEPLLLLRLVLYLHVSKGPSEPRPPHCRGFTITLIHTTLGRTPLDGDWPIERTPPDNTQHLQDTHILVSGGIRTCNPSKRAAADRAATGIRTMLEHNNNNNNNNISMPNTGKRTVHKKT